MPAEVHPSQENESVVSLIKGIVQDVGDLIKQELRFARAEFKTDLRRSGKATGFLVLGSLIAFLGLGNLTLMLVHLLSWLTLPAGTDPAGLPLWVSHALVGCALVGTGAALVWLGKRKFDSFNPLPVETAQSIKENLQWITTSK